MHASTGLDFSGHRRGTIERRVQNRMTSLAIDSRQRYLEVLRSDLRESRALVDRLTIKVSRFYRNAGAFDLLRGPVLRDLARGQPGGELAIWSAGCARGEEAYTLAMLLEEAGVRGSVLATDIDANALAAAAEAVYPESACAELPAQLRRFVEPGARARTVRVHASVRARVTFRHDDLCGAGTVARFSLVACRNVLIYLAPAAQARAFARLEAALAPGAYLLLGEAEWPPSELAARLHTVHHRARLFQAEGAPA